MFISSWNALAWVFVVSITAAIALPVLMCMGWLVYIKLTPAGRAWNAWWDRELTRLKDPKTSSL